MTQIIEQTDLELAHLIQTVINKNKPKTDIEKMMFIRPSERIIVLGVKVLVVNSIEKKVTEIKLKLERNNPCICGSGKKFKRCCQAEVDKLEMAE